MRKTTLVIAAMMFVVGVALPRSNSASGGSAQRPTEGKGVSDDEMGGSAPLVEAPARVPLERGHQPERDSVRGLTGEDQAILAVQNFRPESGPAKGQPLGYYLMMKMVPFKDKNKTKWFSNHESGNIYHVTATLAGTSPQGKHFIWAYAFHVDLTENAVMVAVDAPKSIQETTRKLLQPAENIHP